MAAATSESMVVCPRTDAPAPARKHVALAQANEAQVLRRKAARKCCQSRDFQRAGRSAECGRVLWGLISIRVPRRRARWRPLRSGRRSGTTRRPRAASRTGSPESGGREEEVAHPQPPHTLPERARLQRARLIPSPICRASSLTPHVSQDAPLRKPTPLSRAHAAPYSSRAPLP
eukprot:5270936-Prymnesium_polylepis.1